MTDNRATEPTEDVESQKFGDLIIKNKRNTSEDGYRKVYYYQNENLHSVVCSVSPGDPIHLRYHSTCLYVTWSSLK